MAETLDNPTLEPNPTLTDPPKPPVDPGANDRSWRKGINEEKRRNEARIEAELARYGIKPVLDDKGHIDLAASMQALVKSGQPEVAAKLEERYSSRIHELSTEKANLNSELQKVRVTTSIREKIALQNPVNLDDATDLFLLRYNVQIEDDTQEFIVCNKLGRPIDDELTGRPISIEQAVEKFFAEKPNLREQQKGNGLQGLGSLKGSPRTSTSNDELSERYMEAVQNGDKAKAKELLGEINRRVNAARG